MAKDLKQINADLLKAMGELKKENEIIKYRLERANDVVAIRENLDFLLRNYDAMDRRIKRIDKRTKRKVAVQRKSALKKSVKAYKNWIAS